MQNQGWRQPFIEWQDQPRPTNFQNPVPYGHGPSNNFSPMMANFPNGFSQQYTGAVFTSEWVTNGFSSVNRPMVNNMAPPFVSNFQPRGDGCFSPSFGSPVPMEHTGPGYYSIGSHTSRYWSGFGKFPPSCQSHPVQFQQHPVQFQQHQFNRRALSPAFISPSPPTSLMSIDVSRPPPASPTPTQLSDNGGESSSVDVNLHLTARLQQYFLKKQSNSDYGSSPSESDSSLRKRPLSRDASVSSTEGRNPKCIKKVAQDLASGISDKLRDAVNRSNMSSPTCSGVSTEVEEVVGVRLVGQDFPEERGKKVSSEKVLNEFDPNDSNNNAKRQLTSDTADVVVAFESDSSNVNKSNINLDENDVIAPPTDGITVDCTEPDTVSINRKLGLDNFIDYLRSPLGESSVDMSPEQIANIMEAKKLAKKEDKDVEQDVEKDSSEKDGHCDTLVATGTMFSCLWCSNTFDDVTDFDLHCSMEDHPLICPWCGVTDDKDGRKRKGGWKVHPFEPTNNRQSTSNYECLISHVVSDHSGPRGAFRYLCGQCPNLLSYGNLFCALQHVVKAHGLLSGCPSDVGTYECSICNQYRDSRLPLFMADHMLKSHLLNDKLNRLTLAAGNDLNQDFVQSINVVRRCYVCARCSMEHIALSDAILCCTDKFTLK